MASDHHHSEAEHAPAGDASGEPQPRADPAGEDDGVDRRRLIRWVAALAFAVPVVIELVTFGNLFERELFPDEGDGGGAEATATATDDAVGVGDELLPETAATETVVTSELRGDPSSEQTYVLRVTVENTTAEPVELRVRRLRLRDGTTGESVASSGTVAGGESGELTGAWTIPGGSMPAAVETEALRNGEQVVSRFVDLQRPAIRG